MQTPRANTITRKLGPLPVWAWAGLAVAAWFLFLRGPHTAAGGTQLPYTPQRGSGAQQPQSGQGTPADNAGDDLLSALDGNSTAADALLAALQAGGQGGGYGETSGGGGVSTGGASNSAATADTTQASAPTIDSGTNNAPATQPAGSYVGDTTVQTDAGAVTYGGYTQDPAAVDASGGYANGIVPAMVYRPGSGGSVDPILETASVPTRVSALAYAPTDSNIPNAALLAKVTGQAVAA